LRAAPFNAILWLWSRTSTSTSPSSSPCVSPTTNTPHSTWPRNGDRFLLLLPGRCQSAILICSVRKFVICFELAFFHSYLLNSKLLALSNVNQFLPCVYRAPISSPIRVLTADMFSTPSATFELPSYAAELANVLAELPSPPPTRTRPFNNVVLDFLDIEAKQGEDSDSHGSASR
jgi:hypothetical protein